MAVKSSDINGIIDKIQNNIDSRKMGMIATHIGIVRESSRDGRMVKGIHVTYDYDILKKIINNAKRLPGIVEVVIETNEGDLEIGEIIMFVAIAGDIRENVFSALIETVDRIKRESSRKKEYFK